MTTTVDIDLGAYKLGWSDPEDDYVFKPEKGLSEDIIREMSFIKGERSGCSSSASRRTVVSCADYAHLGRRRAAR